MKRGKTFILGIGAQKAGTTWLEAQFSKEDFLATIKLRNIMFSTGSLVCRQAKLNN